MKNLTNLQSRLPPRIAGLWLSVGLAVIIVVALLLGAQHASDALADSLAPQSSSQRVRLATTPKTNLLVATSPDFPPMEYYSGTQIVGHDIDLMNAIADKMSVTVIYTDVAFGEIITGLVTGGYHAAISSLTVVPGREEKIDFTIPYVTLAENESLAIAVQQGDNALRRQINEALWQLRTEGTLGAIVAAIAADVPDWQPRLPDWPYIPPETESTLVYTDTKQSTTVIHIPPGAVTETILLAYSAVNTATAPPGFAFAGRAFELDAYQNGVFAYGFTFNIPVTVTLSYTDTDLVGLDESTLKLYYWNNEISEWEDSATTCMPHSAYERQPNENWLAIPVCHLSKFALFGQHGIYLPLVLQK